MKKVEIIKHIDSCNDCPFVIDDSQPGTFFCGHKQTMSSRSDLDVSDSVMRLEPMPRWCPLPDVLMHEGETD